jgi:acyl-CoA reductase-like NAD-dependent aldehyde dehydrogenase
MRYRTIQEAVDLANGTRYGLGASVFGPDQSLAVKVARRLECGMVAINDFGVFYVRNACAIGVNLVAHLSGTLPFFVSS